MWDYPLLARTSRLLSSWNVMFYELGMNCILDFNSLFINNRGASLPLSGLASADAGAGWKNSKVYRFEPEEKRSSRGWALLSAMCLPVVQVKSRRADVFCVEDAKTAVFYIKKPLLQKKWKLLEKTATFRTLRRLYIYRDWISKELSHGCYCNITGETGQNG